MILRIFSLFQYLEFVFSIPFIGSLVNLTLSWFGSISRFFVGSRAVEGLKLCNRPKKMLILYQYEGCPFCRLVRESFSVLALDVIIYPCPRTTLARYGVSDDSRFRPEATRLSGKCMFPLLVDANFEPPVVMLESRDIIAHVWAHYGNNAIAPLNFRCANYTPMACFLPSAFRTFPWMGIIRTPSKPPGDKMIELYSYDACPFSRRVREALDSLELPYLLHNHPLHGALPSHVASLQASVQRANSLSPTPVACSGPPFLVDPNTNTFLTNSTECVEYLMKTYAVGKATANWSAYSTQGASSSHGTIPGFARDESAPAGTGATTTKAADTKKTT
jgi:glutathione S-transferase